MPNMIGTIGCFDRIQEYITSSRRRENRTISQLSEENIKSSTEQVIRIHEGAFAYTIDQLPVIHGVNLSVLRGHVAMINGPIGAGKSTLLLGILGELCCIKGDIEILSPEIAFCPQTPWLRNLTVQENIIGPSKFDEDWYNRVIRSCCLEDVISKSKDVGSRGNTLSGGQKQRIVHPI
jgi:ATP-binding cassette subfamily C (CFTR/MRP) protein 1